MGYTTNFTGGFTVSPKMSPKIKEFLTGLATTRRMKRNLSHKLYGIEGEFFVEGGGFRGQDGDESIIDRNGPAKTQPGLWCQWIPNEEGTEIVWDDGEKFYEYTAWIKYIIDKILAPNGYKVNGKVIWQGEDTKDRGKITIKDNKIVTKVLE